MPRVRAKTRKVENAHSPTELQRTKFYAHRYLRLLTKTAAAQELGPSVCWLLAVVAMQEDAKRYTEPAKWYLDQLTPLCGFQSKQTLITAINRAQSEGWLHYQPGSKGRPGKFATVIPTRFLDLEDSPCDESIPNIGRNGGDAVQLMERKRNESGMNPECKGSASIPIPIPNPNTSVSSKRTNVYPSEFETFWKAFPSKRREKKGKALTAWNRATKSVDAETLIRRASEYASSPVGKSEFVKGPEPWLKGSCWEDAPEAWGIQSDESSPPRKRLRDAL
jgi:hypothetical protein